MPVIAMTREMGSAGKDVASGLARVLALEVVHHEVVEHSLAECLQVGESAVHRYLEGHAGLLERWRFDARGVAYFTAEQVLDLAERGDVLIRGWGAAHLLRSVPHVVCLRVCAPLALRVQRVMGRIGLDDEALARKEIETNDAAHARVIRRLFSAGWDDPLHYDLVLNTERLSVEECVDLVLRLLGQPAFEETAASREALARLRRQVRASSPAHGVVHPDEAHLVRHLHTKLDERPRGREERDLLL